MKIMKIGKGFKKQFMELKKTAVLLIVLIFMPVTIASAHRVIIFAWAEEGVVFSESYFDAEKRAANCKITVVDENGDIVHTGRTDKNGNYSFKIPDNLDAGLMLHLDAGQGHKAHWKISLDELIADSGKSSVEKAVETRKELKKSPPVYKIVAGVGIIFFLAFSLKFIKRKRYNKND